MASLFLNSEVDNEKSAILFNINRFTNQVYKLLPMREQGEDWQKLLETLIVEIKGMKKIVIGQENLFLLILCKLEGLFSLVSQEDMKLYRRTIFQCLGLLNNLKDNIIND